MKRKLLLMMASLLLAGAVSAQTNYWGNDPNSHAQPSNTPIVASVQIDGDDVTATTDMRLGAFVGDDLRGIAAKHTDGKFWIQVFYTAQTDNITFKFYNGETEYTTCETTLAGSDEGYGTPNEPQVLNFTTTQTQTTAMTTGWNWWSTYIEITNGAVALTALETSLGHNGISIKSQNGGVENYYQYTGSDYWYGPTLTSINNEQGYKINVSNDCDVEMVGNYADPSEHEIGLSRGWNWIGYPVSEQQGLSSALSGFTPTANDVIKSQSGGATYYAGYGWYSGSNQFVMKPGQSYQYYSNADENTLVYSHPSSKGPDLVREIPTLYWSNNIHSHPDNILIVATIEIDEIEQQNDNIELGAFVNGECRGSAKLDYFEPTNRWYAILTVTGVVGDEVSFGIYNDLNRNIDLSCVDHVTFANNNNVGNLDSPLVLHFGTSDELHAFPNPISANQPFTLDIPAEESVCELFVINSMGVVLRHEIGLINGKSIAGVPTTGVYTIRTICNSGKIYNTRIVVK